MRRVAEGENFTWRAKAIKRHTYQQKCMLLSDAFRTRRDQNQRKLKYKNTRHYAENHIHLLTTNDPV